MGEVKMAQTLARAGVHLGATTVGRTAGPCVHSSDDRFTLEIGFHSGRRYLPIVALKRAA
jgi:hypothetical protein